MDTAASQYITACWLKPERKSDAPNTVERSDLNSGQPWGMIHRYYAAMGGFVVDLPWMESNGNSRVAITADGVRLLSFAGLLLDFTKSQIEDKVS